MAIALPLERHVNFFLSHFLTFQHQVAVVLQVIHHGRAAQGPGRVLVLVLVLKQLQYLPVHGL